MLINALNFFIEFMYPTVCGICGKLNKNWICEKCYKRLNKYKIKINIENKNVLEKYYDKLLYIFKYDGLVRKLILKYKFNNEAYLSNLFADIILKEKELCEIIKYYNFIIPVPMFEKKKKQRGYNQTELIAEKISKKLNIVLRKDIVIKIRNTKVQSTLSGLERKENIKNAFCINEVINTKEIQNKNIIIFDDIFTTGETVNEISRILKQEGAEQILVIVLARD